MIDVIAVVGPTAVGKTKLSIEIAKKYQGAIISGDSMQVYRKLDIGTAKITTAEMQGVKHYLIDICDVGQRFSVADFQVKASAAIATITANQQLPIIAGGTGFYLQSIDEQRSFGDDEYSERSKVVRTELEQFAEEHGNSALWNRLNEVDSDAAVKIPENNVVRIIRALEVFELTGQQFSKQQLSNSIYNVHFIGLNTDRQVLYDRINNRVDQMLEDGLEQEAKWLYDQGGRALPAGKGIGYHELFDYFAGLITKDQAIEKIKKDSRHYAKRQLTWFNHHANVRWFDLVGHKNTIADVFYYIDSLKLN